MLRFILLYFLGISFCSAQPRLYCDFDTFDDDIYNKAFVFAAAESCGVDTAVDAITIVPGWGYCFIKAVPLDGPYRVVRTQRVDAQWENGRLVMYGCFDDEFDTVFVIDTFPEWAPKVRGFDRVTEAFGVYDLCRRFVRRYQPQRHMERLEKQEKNRYLMMLRAGYSVRHVGFYIINDSVVVKDDTLFVN